MKGDLGGVSGLADAVAVELGRREEAGGAMPENLLMNLLKNLHGFLSTLPKEVASSFLSRSWRDRAPASYANAMERFAFHHLFYTLSAVPTVAARQAVVDKWNYGERYSATSLEVMGEKRSLTPAEAKERDAEATRAMLAAGKGGLGATEGRTQTSSSSRPSSAWGSTACSSRRCLRPCGASAPRPSGQWPSR
jgi:hypothetical protein